MTETPVNIIIADDHPVYRFGLKEIIESDKSLKVLFEASDGDAAFRFIQEHKPRVAVLDLEMPLMSGLDVANLVQQQNIPVSIIMLTMHDEEEFFNKAMDLGIMGYLLKDSATLDILTCIKSVLNGKPFISPSISGLALKRRGNRSEEVESQLNLTSLTTTERKILALVARNKTTQEIANELFVSPKTVENHRSSICMKLGLRGHNSLVRFVFEHKEKLLQ